MKSGKPCWVYLVSKFNLIYLQYWFKNCCFSFPNLLPWIKLIGKVWEVGSIIKIVLNIAVWRREWYYKSFTFLLFYFSNFWLSDEKNKFWVVYLKLNLLKLYLTSTFLNFHLSSHNHRRSSWPEHSQISIKI